MQSKFGFTCKGSGAFGKSSLFGLSSSFTFEEKRHTETSQFSESTLLQSGVGNISCRSLSGTPTHFSVEPILAPEEVPKIQTFDLPTIFGVYKYTKKSGIIDYEYNGTQSSISYDGDNDYIKAKHSRDGIKVAFKMVTDQETGEVSIQNLYQMRRDPIRTGIHTAYVKMAWRLTTAFF